MLEDLAVALTEALQDEYKARATYRAIIDRFGAVRPFINILAAEERHIQALIPLFSKYGIPIPADDWPARIEVPTSLPVACQEGVQAEIENGEMYDRLFVLASGYPEVQRVFQRLQRASQENHLPAFQRCATRGNGRGMKANYSHPESCVHGRHSMRRPKAHTLLKAGTESPSDHLQHAAGRRRHAHGCGNSHRRYSGQGQHQRTGD